MDFLKKKKITIISLLQTSLAAYITLPWLKIYRKTVSFVCAVKQTPTIDEMLKIMSPLEKFVFNRINSREIMKSLISSTPLLLFSNHSFYTCGQMSHSTDVAK